MSTPPVASRPDSKVADAACLMLKVPVPAFSPADPGPAQEGSVVGHVGYHMVHAVCGRRSFVTVCVEHPRPCPPTHDACLCALLQHKVHRIPVVDYNTQVVGIVTRTDIFTALALNEGSPELLTT